MAIPKDFRTVFGTFTVKTGGFPHQCAHWLGMTPLFRRAQASSAEQAFPYEKVWEGLGVSKKRSSHNKIQRQGQQGVIPVIGAIAGHEEQQQHDDQISGIEILGQQPFQKAVDAGIPVGFLWGRGGAVTALLLAGSALWRYRLRRFRLRLGGRTRRLGLGAMCSGLI